MASTVRRIFQEDFGRLVLRKESSRREICQNSTKDGSVTYKIRMIYAVEINRANDAIASAFSTVPIIQRIYDDYQPASLLRKLAAMLPYYFLRFEKNSRLFVAENLGLVVGALLMSEPDHPPLPDRTQELFREVSLLIGSAEDLERWGHIGDGMHSIFDESAFHISVVGVHPSRQNSGIGSALVEAALAIVDSDHDSVFLNAYTESNVRFYERFGFKVEAEATLSDRTPGIWLGM